MYVPAQFDVTDRAWALALIERYPFGLLITGDAEYPRVSHIPLIARERGGELALIGHVAKANPHARSIAAGARATVVFQGPHAYVSASWYEQPYATVPTWNYAAVQVMGLLRDFDSWEAVRLLSEAMEGSTADAWSADRLDESYRENQLRGIVAFELHAEAIYAKAKLSQNRTENDRVRVVERLLASKNQTDRECAEAMLRALEDGAEA